MNSADASAISTLLAGGGFTYSPHSGFATEGFVVSLFPELERKTKYTPSNLAESVEDVKKYIKEHEDILGHPCVYCGGWWAYEDTQYDYGEYFLYLDVVVLCHNKRAAATLGKKYHQLAFFNIEGKEECPIPYTEEELLSRLDGVPEPKKIKAYHLSRGPIKGGVLRADRRGESDHEEAERLRLPSAIGGVCLYFEKVEPERMIENRPWASDVEGYWALADFDDRAVIRLILDKIGTGPRKGSLFYNKMEKWLFEAGYDGYHNKGKIVVFSDVKVDSSYRRQA